MRLSDKELKYIIRAYERQRSRNKIIRGAKAYFFIWFFLVVLGGIPIWHRLHNIATFAQSQPSVFALILILLGLTVLYSCRGARSDALLLRICEESFSNQLPWILEKNTLEEARQQVVQGQQKSDSIQVSKIRDDS
jgi:hypothetical protein